MSGAARQFRFGPFAFDSRSGVLTRDGRRVRLSHQSASMLRTLLDEAGRVVTRDELRRALWPDGTHVDYDHGLNNAAARLRRALDDSADAARYIETVPKVGYRFIGPIERYPLAPIEPHPVLPVEPDPEGRVFRPGHAPYHPRKARAVHRVVLAGASALLLFVAGLGTGVRLASRLPPVPARATTGSALEARAQAERSLIYTRMVLDCDVPADLVAPSADRSAKRALALDPALPDAHVAAAYVAMWARWDWVDAARAIDAALALDRDAAGAHHARALWLAAQGRTTEAREAIAYARRQAPDAIDLARDAARLAYVAGHVEAAVADLRVLLAAHPDDADGHQLMSDALASIGRNAEAAAHYRQYLVLVGVAARFADEDRRQFAARGLAGLTRWYLSRPSGKPRDRYGVPFKMASSHAVVGDADAALQWLEQAVAQRDSRLLLLRVHPRFAGLRSDPRFAAILQRLGLRL